jgi:hypothetical protein
MFHQKPVPVPPPATERFENGIAHPSLWLWDSWTTELDGALHLHCLALSRVDAAGQPIDPSNRNDYPFHIRSFQSFDNGASWQDNGAFLQPQDHGDGSFARNVWSGGILARAPGPWIAGFTGIRQMPDGRPFLQTICMGLSDNGKTLDALPAAALSCPLRDYDDIRAAGYYLPDLESLGAAEGEEGGPILAWRDPFILDAGNGRFEVFWSAKAAPARPAVAHATVQLLESRFRIETLHPPILLPDDSRFTQAEVPKICRDAESGTFYMLISACDRINEDQPADEVTKRLRLYKAASLRGPWFPAFGNKGSSIPDTENLFGGSILKADFRTGQLHLIAPYSEYAACDKQLTFAPVRIIALSPHGSTVPQSST